MENDKQKNDSFEQTQRTVQAIDGQTDQQPTDADHDDLQIYDDHEEQQVHDETKTTNY